MSRVWFRNPADYIGQVIESTHVRFLWHKGYLVTNRIDHKAFVKLLMPGIDWEYMVIEDYGAVHYMAEHGRVAVYPTWDYQKDSYALLEEMASNPAGSDMAAITDKKTPPNERPLANQKHVIVLTDIPTATSNVVKKFYMRLVNLQADTGVSFFIDSTSSFRIAFGLGFEGAGMDPNLPAKKGTILLPSGRAATGEKIHQFPMWTRGMFGFSPNDLIKSSDKRLAYNIASMIYSESNYLKLISFKPGAPAVDITSTQDDFTLPETKIKSPLSGVRLLAKDQRDKVNCDTCSLFDNCKYAREGSVCGVPGSEGASLANLMGSRDADTIIDGMAAIQGMLSKRLERKLNMEDAIGEDDPEVLKITGMLFRQGSELAKLLDPNLRGTGTKVEVNMAGAHNGISGGTITDPKQAMADIAKALTARGIPIKDQTPKMVAEMLQLMGASDEKKARTIEAIVNTVDAE